MPKQKQPIEVEIKPGKEFETLADARRAALPFLVDSMLGVIQEMLERGELVMKDNQIMPRAECKQ